MIGMDWCYACAEQYCEKTVDKLFAWILIDNFRRFPNYYLVEEAKDGNSATLTVFLSYFDEQPVANIMHDSERYWWLAEVFRNSLILSGKGDVSIEDITYDVDETQVVVKWKKGEN